MADLEKLTKRRDRLNERIRRMLATPNADIEEIIRLTDKVVDINSKIRTGSFRVEFD
ncbi:MAG: hypothetical protein ACXIUV_07040 [Alkalilacustris sp.]